MPVKVTAWIDEGIAPLVTALNEFDGVATLQSCQGGEGRDAYVYFTIRGCPADKLADHVGRWVAALGDQVEYLFRMEWLPGTKTPLIQLLLPPTQVEPVASRLSELAHGERP